jgi:hypothetical protein
MPGDFVVMLDGERRPRFIWRITDVTIKPLSQSTRRLLATRGRGTAPETGGSTPIAAISLGKRAANGLRQTTKSSQFPSDSGSCGRSILRMRSWDRLRQTH